MLLALHRPKLLAILTAVIISTGVILISQINDQNEKTSHLFDQHGKSLATHIAESISQHIVDNDIISIQATLQRVAQQVTAESIIVYDINHSILAQFASNTPIKATQLKHYTAQIITGERTSGSVSVSLDANQAGVLSVWLLVPTLILLLLTPMLGAQSFTLKKPNDNSSPKETPITNTMNHLNGYFVFIKIINWDILFQQLNAESRIAHLGQLEAMILKVCELYRSQLIANTDDGFIIAARDNHQESALHAFYSAQLILQLNTNNPDAMLELKLAIQKMESGTPFHHSLEDAQKLLSAKSSQGELFIHREITQTTHFNSYAELDDDNEYNLIAVKELTQTYKELLDKQVQQLQIKKQST